MPINISALKVELQTDPKALGFSTFVAFRDLNKLVDLLNTKGLTNDTVSIGTITAMTLQQNVVAAEYIALTAAQRNLWDGTIFTCPQVIALSNTLVRGQIGPVWSAATSTRGNLSNLQVRAASRTEALFGEGEVANTGHVDLALR